MGHVSNAKQNKTTLQLFIVLPLCMRATMNSFTSLCVVLSLTPSRNYNLRTIIIRQGSVLICFTSEEWPSKTNLHIIHGLIILKLHIHLCMRTRGVVVFRTFVELIYFF